MIQAPIKWQSCKSSRVLRARSSPIMRLLTAPIRASPLFPTYKKPVDSISYILSRGPCQNIIPRSRRISAPRPVTTFGLIPATGRLVSIRLVPGRVAGVISLGDSRWRTCSARALFYRLRGLAGKNRPFRGHAAQTRQKA